MVQTVDFARLRRVAKRATPLERRVILRDFLATLPPERFDMGWLHSRNREAITPAKAPVKFARDCGTAACLAGWINTLCAPTNLAALDVVDATQFLGLSKWQGDDLFLPRGIGSPERYPLSRAVETLTRLVETGEVDWGPEPLSGGALEAPFGAAGQGNDMPPNSSANPIPTPLQEKPE